MHNKECVVSKEKVKNVHDTSDEFVCGPINVRIEYAEGGSSMQEMLTEFLKKCQKEVVVNG